MKSINFFIIKFKISSAETFFRKNFWLLKTAINHYHKIAPEEIVN